MLFRVRCRQGCLQEHGSDHTDNRKSNHTDVEDEERPEQCVNLLVESPVLDEAAWSHSDFKNCKHCIGPSAEAIPYELLQIDFVFRSHLLLHEGLDDLRHEYRPNQLQDKKEGH